MKSPRLVSTLTLALAASVLAVAQSPAKHPLTLDDASRIKDVRDPRCSSDGSAVAYVVSTIDVKADRSNSHIWVPALDGSSDRQMTFSSESESSPRWSPDGSTWRSPRRGPGRRRATRCGC